MVLLLGLRQAARRQAQAPAQGLAGLTLVTSLLVNGSPVWGALGNLFGSKPTTPLSGTTGSPGAIPSAATSAGLRAPTSRNTCSRLNTEVRSSGVMMWMSRIEDTACTGPFLPMITQRCPGKA